MSEACVRWERYLDEAALGKVNIEEEDLLLLAGSMDYP